MPPASPCLTPTSTFSIAAWRCRPEPSSVRRASCGSTSAPSAPCSKKPCSGWPSLSGWVFRHIKVRRRQVGVIALIHLPIRILEMPGGQFGVEQRRGQPVLRELAPDLRKPCGIRRQPDRQFFILLLRGGNEFGQANGIEQARCHPAGEGLPDERQQGQSDPQRVACRGVGVARQRVDEQVRGTLARQVFRDRQPPAKYQSLGAYPACLSGCAQIARGGGVVFE